MRKNLLGHIQIDSRLLIIDIRKFIFNPTQYQELGLLINTNGPVCLFESQGQILLYL